MIERRAFGFGLPQPGRLVHAVAATAVVNILLTLMSATAGVIIARDLGPSRRGDYAAVNVWFFFVLIIGELGLTASTTYHVARYPERAQDAIATARTIMSLVGCTVAGLGFLMSNYLAHGDHELAQAYRIMFVACVPSFVTAGYAFALQARSLSRWNLMRVAQPAPYLILVLVLHSADELTFRSSIEALASTVLFQALVAFQLCRSIRLVGGSFDNSLAGPMLRYGFSQLLASAPSAMNARLDQLVLSLTAKSASLGQYAVAVTLTSLIVPVISSIGHVAFPNLAARRTFGPVEQRMQRVALLTSGAVGVMALSVVCAIAPWLVPFLFGPDYDAAIALVWILAPGGALLGVGLVASDLLRGRGRPLAVAWGQGAGAVASVLLLVALLPTFGVVGAAVASSVAYGVTLGVLLIALRQDGSLNRWRD